MRNRFVLPVLLLAAALRVSGPGLSQTPPALELRKGDHVCIVGGGFADRMQHYSWFEALVYAAFPDHDLVFRNLGFAGDEVTVRQRSEGFGSTADWLKHERADVVFIFFGYNEAFKGPAALGAFKRELEKFVRETRAANYSGKGSTRVVLFSPTAAEKHADPNLPGSEPLNRNLKLYAAATAETARKCAVPFVDLFAPSLAAYARAARPLTVNGVHLTDEGYRALAPVMFEALFGRAAPAAPDKLRAAVDEKNRLWHSRYRTMDGYNVYGGRSYLQYEGVKNRDTMQREMEMRDVMTANRDRRVWAVSRGQEFEVRDDNLPPPIEVKTNKPGPNPDKTFPFLGGEEAIGRMKVPPGCKVNLFASEERFPELVNPVQMAFDTRGRLWVAVWPNYPERTPWSTKGDSLLVLEDTDGDGKADKATPFVTDLNCPTGFQFYRDGVLLVQAPDVWFLRDTDGDGRADSKQIVLGGLDSADSHHTANSLVLDPGGAIYLSDGVFHRTQVETSWGPPVRNLDAAIYRYEPRTGKFETYVSYAFANPHGRVFDYWGNDFVTDATGNHTYFGPAFWGRIDFPEKHRALRQLWERPSRPSPGTGMLSSRHFPEEFQENFLNLNVIGFQGVYRVRTKEEGSGLWGDIVLPHLIESDDPNFRPTGIDVGPDGALYLLDWQNPIIGHMQHHLRDPNRDHLHGRIYRITYEGRPLLQRPAIAGQPVNRLLDLLLEPETGTRTRAKIELGARDTAEVLAAVQKWVQRFDPAKLEDQHARLEALWVHQWHNVVNEPLLRQMLKSPEPRARAAAVRVLCYWRDRVPDALALVRAAANDGSARVRLEALRAASFFTGTPAMEAACDVLKHEMDYYLEYTFKETTRQLQKSIPGVFLPTDPTALRALPVRMPTRDLLDAAGEEAVLVERLERPGLSVKVRSASLTALAARRKSTPAREAIAILKDLDTGERPASAAEEVGYLVASLPRADLSRRRAELAGLAASGKKAPVRRAAYAGMVAADGKPDAVWTATAGDRTARTLLIDSIGLHPDAAFRAGFAQLLDKVLSDPSSGRAVREAALLALPLMGPERAGKAFQLLAENLRAGRDMAASARALMQLPRPSWSTAAAAPAANGILDWARTVPADRRADTDFVVTVQAGRELAASLPPPDAARLTKQLLALGVRIFSLRAVREQMRYDVGRLVVEAGKPFQILFENSDMMPHNVAIAEPRSRAAIGAKADAMSAVPDSQGRTFVPDDRRILAATSMVEPGRAETLKLTAPRKPGNYDYFCTYPEHWKTMYGQLVVVEDLEAYMKSAEAAKPLAQPAGASPAGHAKH
jgi:glucose/arabinose dehydrogenase/azurin